MKAYDNLLTINYKKKTIEKSSHRQMIKSKLITIIIPQIDKNVLK